MRTSRVLTASTILLLSSGTTLADEVTLPAPVLEWSFYILLIFAVFVVIGISFFVKGRNWPGDTLDSLIDRKSPTIRSVCPEVSVTECVSLMNDHRIGAMLVMEDDQLLGIFTERDAISRVLGAGLDPTSTNVSEVMTRNPVCVSALTTLEEAMSIVTNQRIRHLPVLEDAKVLGVVSSGDITHRLLKD